MAGYIGVQPVPQATQTRQTFTATASQTTFNTLGYTPGFVDVFLNGVKLIRTTDYTDTNGSDIVLTTGAAASDTVEVISYSTYEVNSQNYTGDLSVDTDTLYVDSTNDRVGIGTDSPAGVLEAYDTSNAIVLSTTTTGYSGFRSRSTSGNFYSTIDDSTGSAFSTGAYSRVFWSDGAYPMVFGTNSTEAARIDSSGNLLVGTTTILAAESNVEGISLAAGSYGGLLSVSRDGNRAATFNRKTSDGDILEFRKDGSTVGSIGTADGFTYYTGGSGSGVKMKNAAVVPTSGSGVDADGTESLGQAAARWNNLYLSGGVYLGGTGSANYLDDYEEGTWTPTSGGAGSLTVNNGAYYTKVGRNVTLHINSAQFSDVTSTTNLAIDGLPFAPSGSSAVGITMMSYRDDTVTITPFIPSSASQIRFYRSSTTAGFNQVPHNILNNTFNALYLSITYQTA